MEERKRIFWPDFIRAVACICIFVIHYNATVSSNFMLDNGVGVNNILDMYLGTIGVNLFFIISGAMLMLVRIKKGKEKSIFTFYYKRFLTLYPMYWLAFIAATCICFWVFRKMPSDSILWMLNGILGFDGYLYVLGITPFAFYQVGEWFFGCIVCLYIIAPILLGGMEKYPGITVVSCLVMWVFLIYMKVPEQLFLMYIPHMLFGMIFIKYSRKISIKTAAIVIVAMLCVYLWPYKKADGVVYSLIQCCNLFIVLGFMGQCIKFEVIQGIFIWIAKYSYPIFLVHHRLITLLALRFDLSNLATRDIWLLFFMYCVLTAVFSMQLAKISDKIILSIRRRL